MTIQDFFNSQNGKFLDADNAYGPQCVDVIKQFFKDVLGRPPVTGNALDYSKGVVGFNWMKNTPVNCPRLGDIIVWGTGVGQYGHIAICQSANVWSFTSFDQNWPLNSPCHFQKHNYKNVLGWLRLIT